MLNYKSGWAPPPPSDRVGVVGGRVDLFSGPPSTTAAAPPPKPKTPLQSEELASFNFLSGGGPESGGGPPDRIYGRYRKTGGEGGGAEKRKLGFCCRRFRWLLKKVQKCNPGEKRKIRRNKKNVVSKLMKV